MPENRDSLFKPFSIKNLELKNRIAMAPMTRNQSPGGVPTDDVVAYYRRRAQGGVGLIISEGTVVGHVAANGYPDVPFFYSDPALAGWKKVILAVHEAGARMFPQIWHTGSVRKKGMGPVPAVPGYGPSAVPHPFYGDKGETPHAMTIADIDEVVAAFADSARFAKELGFDGVEIHGAHGYLIDQFFWPRTNRREDAYGGSLENRARLATRIIAASRQAVGPDFPIQFRFSQWKMGDFETRLAQTPQELETFLSLLTDAGVDIFHCSTRRFWDPEFQGSDLNLAGWTKKLTGKPTVTVGSVGLDQDFISSMMGQNAGVAKIDNLIERMDRGEFDLVAVGRALLADPEWSNKIKQGRDSDITAFDKTKHMDGFY